MFKSDIFEEKLCTLNTWLKNNINYVLKYFTEKL